MARVRVVTDSSCDLPEGLAAEHGITIIPLTVRFGENEFVDRRDLTPAQFWARCAESPVLPTTAAPSPGAFEEAFRAALVEGCDGVACITLSAALSATYSVADLAARAVTGTIGVRVVDSRSVTMALGNMCVAAARAAALGESLDDVVGVAEELVGRTRMYAALDDLESLRKGGRIGGARAMVGSMLSIKPIIEVRDGKVEKESQQRTRTRSLRYLADKVREFPGAENLAVMHGGAPDVEQMLDLLAPLAPRHEVMVGDLGPVVGAHAGPRTMGITFQIPR